MDKKRLKKILIILVLALMVFMFMRFYINAQVQLLQQSEQGSPAELTVETAQPDSLAVVPADDNGSDTGQSGISASSSTETEGPVIDQDALQEYKVYRFRSSKLLNQHYEKHGIEMGFASAAEYEQAASDVVNNPAALHKTEKEDGDDIYYVEATNEFVVVSTDGYIRTFFCPDSGKKYFDKQ